MQKQNFEDSSAGLLDLAEESFVSRYRDKKRFQCVALLKFFQAEGRFPKNFDDLCGFFGSEIEDIGSYDPQSGTSIRQRADIRKFLGFRPVKTEDYERVQSWLCSGAIQEPNDKGTHDYVRQWFRDRKIELPASGQIDRIVNSSLSSFEDHLFQKIAAGLSDHSKQAIDQLFVPGNGGEMEGTTAPFSLMKLDPGKPNRDSIFEELSKLAEIDALDLPAGLFQAVPEKALTTYRQRAATESIRDMRLHPPPIRLYTCHRVLP